MISIYYLGRLSQPVELLTISRDLSIKFHVIEIVWYTVGIYIYIYTPLSVLCAVSAVEGVVLR